MRRVLEGRRIAVTRPQGQGEKLAACLSSKGAAVSSFPLISIRPCFLPAVLKEVLREAPGFDWICFTSANGVGEVMRFALENGLAENLKAPRKACIGAETAAALKAHGFSAPLVPEIYHAEGLLESFEKMGIRGKKFLLLRAKGARPVLRTGLENAGGEVVEISVYEALPEEEGQRGLARAIGEKTVDVITFTSSSTVLSFQKILEKTGPEPFCENRIKLASIGPVTSRSLRQIGLAADIEARRFLAEGLADAIEEHFRNPVGPVV